MKRSATLPPSRLPIPCSESNSLQTFVALGMQYFSNHRLLDGKGEGHCASKQSFIFPFPKSGDWQYDLEQRNTSPDQFVVVLMVRWSQSIDLPPNIGRNVNTQTRTYCENPFDAKQRRRYWSFEMSWELVSKTPFQVCAVHLCKLLTLCTFQCGTRIALPYFGMTFRSWVVVGFRGTVGSMCVWMELLG